ncbi:hypothetical protein GCM10010458_36510 [Microbacterium luteolum]|uniref:IclR-ED domain-containing protein n=1 Tax=Microbacterium luteolum TaxID=69367 RepID=A0ABY7XKU1_MICLT|nr:hypothetical protein [Microbacterium luteolum]WDM42516.1 hypothetical protein KV395_04185 [Microbacterium luteolum]
MWPAISLTVRVIIVAYTVLVGLGAALKAIGVITPLPSLESWVWFVSLIVLGVENVVTLIVRHFRTRRGDRAAKLEDALASALIQIVRASPALHLEELGANVYVVSRFDWFLKKPHAHMRLRRVARLRPARYPQQSGVEWASGKGAVGLCWEAKKRVYKDWHAVAERYGEADMDQETFDQIPAGTRCGFSRAEFQSIVGKYSEVVAEPIWDPRKTGVILGVITIDRAYRSSNEVHVPRLNKRTTHESVGIAAGVVSRILKLRGAGD